MSWMSCQTVNESRNRPRVNCHVRPDLIYPYFILFFSLSTQPRRQCPMCGPMRVRGDKDCGYERLAGIKNLDIAPLVDIQVSDPPHIIYSIFFGFLLVPNTSEVPTASPRILLTNSRAFVFRSSFLYDTRIQKSKCLAPLFFVPSIAPLASPSRRSAREWLSLTKTQV